MQDEEKKKNVRVTIILTESTASFLQLNAPHLEHFHPEDSKLCLITASDSTKLKKQEQIDTEVAGTSNVEQNSSTNQINLQEQEINNIASNLAFFSTNQIQSSSSCVYDKSNESVSEETPSTLFEAIKIDNWPLVSVRSMAHTDKLEVVSNDIYVSLLDSESQSSYEYICRICHAGDSFADLLTPCRCRGTIALVHLTCLERWLKESSHSHCELCQHHFKIIREPKYCIPWSILVFLRHPGPHFREIIFDLLAFAIYTPSAVASTFMLLTICEALVKSEIMVPNSLSSHIIAFSAVFGMAAIDFTYSSWIVLCMQKHYEAWSEWYKNTSTIKVVLPKVKQRPKRTKKKSDFK